MSNFSERIASLSPAQRALFAARLAKMQPKTPDSGTISPRVDNRPAPLSFPQQRMRFLDELMPGMIAYNVGFAFRMRGRLDVASLERALHEVERRHDSLRTRFPYVDGQAVQVVEPFQSSPLPQADLRDAANPEEAVRRLLVEQGRTPFDLAAAPTFRPLLVRVAQDEHYLSITLHHIVFDAWSIGVLAKELEVLYGAFVRGMESPLPELPIQYGDFAVWQRDRIRGAFLETELAHWRAHLDGAPTLLDLPLDRTRPTIPSYNGAQQSITLPLALTTELRELARAEEGTLFVTLLAIYGVLLGRYSGQREVLVGSPIANRDQQEIEGMIGFFANTTLLRLDLGGDPTFRELLRRFRESAFDTFDHREMPLEKLVEELAPERHAGRQPFFQASLSLQNTPMPPLNLPELEVDLILPDLGTAKFDLGLRFVETNGDLVATLEYRTDLFEHETAGRMLEHFRTLTKAALEDPDRPITRLPMLTDAEKADLAKWNDTSTEYPRDATIPELFERQMQRTPEAIAVEFGEQRLTYKALDRLANGIAHALRTQGVEPEELVALRAERGPGMIAAMVGILKAGGAYLPIEPECPDERLRFILEDSGARVLLTDTASSIGSVAVVRLDSCPGADDPPTRSIRAESLAYAIYTSGSTGRPKGVTIPQRAVVRLLFHTNYIELTAEDRIAQVSNPAFDAATFEVWGALLHGGCLVGIERETLLSPISFAESLQARRIGVMFLTAALFNQVAASRPDAFRGLRHLMVGGEALDPRWVRAVLEAGPPAKLLNGYGPTESTTFASFRIIDSLPPDAVSVPIGQPLANTRLHVLDDLLQPVPVGIRGELYIGGDGLAREYLHRPELTAEKFLSFDGDPDGRVYRTGDLVKRLPDGAIEFLGRRDHQIKLRGFRIELGEIEMALGRHEAVRECVVTLWGAGTETPRLVAYYVPRGRPSDAEPLRTFLGATLPEYMLPAAFVPLQQLPLTANGKIDRRALPSPDTALPEEPVAAPRTPVESELCLLLAEALKVERVGALDDFFALGGHSLLAAQLAKNVCSVFGVELPLHCIFDHPTAVGLAAALESREVHPGQAKRIAELRQKVRALSPEEVTAALRQ